MSNQPATSISTAASYCQHISPRGRRCHMLIDTAHRSADGAKHPSVCPYHANRLKAAAIAPDPEVVANELLGYIDDFSTAAEINLFIGNLVKQFARKRIPRRDAVALGYLSQLLLSSLPALHRQRQDEKEAAAEQLLLSQVRRRRAAVAAAHAANAAATRANATLATTTVPPAHAGDPQNQPGDAAATNTAPASI